MLNSIQGKENIFVADVRAERLFREAEDDFFYFNKVDDALIKIEKALEISPNMIKALLMKANIVLLGGEIEKSLKLYKKAEAFAPNNIKVLSGIANIYELINQNSRAYEYIEKALSQKNLLSCSLIKALIDLKITVLIKQKKYLEAQKIMNESKSFLSQEDYMSIQANNLSVLKKKLTLQKKLNKINLKLVK